MGKRQKRLAHSKSFALTKRHVQTRASVMECGCPFCRFCICGVA